MTGNYKQLDYEIHQTPNSTWAGSIESDLVRFYDYRTKDDIVAAIKGTIRSLEHHDLGTRQDRQGDQASVDGLRPEGMGVDESRQVQRD
jgi:hypothetical protein